jgi:hypothetical protein
MSPDSFLENGADPLAAAGRLPLQQSVSSASAMPSSHCSARPRQSSDHFEKYRQVIENLRRAHEGELELWRAEREGFKEHIKELERQIRLLKGPRASDASSVSPGHIFRSGVFGSTSSHGSKESSLAMESWRGPSEGIPNRVFPPSSVRHSSYGAKPSLFLHRSLPETSGGSETDTSWLPSIVEDGGKRRKSVGFLNEAPTISAAAKTKHAMIDKNFDGISFKPGAFPMSVVKTSTPQTPSPFHSTPSTNGPSGRDLAVPAPPSPDPYTKDAGHTPLARRSFSGLDGVLSPVSASSGRDTPRVERPPLEPHPSVAPSRPPNERAESYFPAITEMALDPDPSLTGPLGLINESEEDSQFLSELDQKLQEAAQIRPGTDEGQGAGQEGFEQDSFDQPESEPRLRIKRSTNFGSAFGAKNCGKFS